MRDRKKRNMVIGLLCAVLVVMGVGYAILSQTLTINGEATITGTWDIYIKEITTSTKSDTASYGTYSRAQDKLSADFSAQLQRPGDYVEYNVVVKNDGNIDAVLQELIPTFETQNPDIILTHTIIHGQILKANSETAFKVKVTFDERAQEIPASNKIEFTIQMIYNQYDGDATGIDPTAVPVTANDCFTIDNEGTITGYDQKCGTYVTVPAAVNGTVVTGISSSAFVDSDSAASNTTIYDDGNDEIFVANDQETYDGILSMFLEQDVTQMTSEEYEAAKQDFANMLYLEGDPNIPDLTGFEAIPVHFNPNMDEFGDFEDLDDIVSTSNIEYLDLSQAAAALESIDTKSFATSNTLKYLNIYGLDSDVLDDGVFTGADLEYLVLDTELFFKVFSVNASDISIENLIIYPGESTIFEDKDTSNNNINIDSLILKEGITSVGNYNFDNYHISNLILPSTLTTIGNSAFSFNSLTSVTIPNSVTTIGSSAFENNKFPNNYTIDLSNHCNLTNIGQNVFSGLGTLTVIARERVKYNGSTVPLGNTSMGNNATLTITSTTTCTNPLS